MSWNNNGHSEVQTSSIITGLYLIEIDFWLNLQIYFTSTLRAFE